MAADIDKELRLFRSKHDAPEVKQKDIDRGKKAAEYSSDTKQALSALTKNIESSVNLGGREIYSNLETAEDRIASEIEEKNAGKNALEKKLNNIENEKKEALDNLERLHGESSSKWKTLEDKSRESSDLYNHYNEDLRREPQINLDMRISLTVLAILFIGEAQINRMAFEAVFFETPLASFIVALVLGGGITFISHWMGTIARQTEGATPDIRRTKHAVCFIAISGLVALVYFISLIRQQFLDGIRSGGVNRSVFSTAPNKALESLDSIGFSFFGINLALIGVGVIGAWVSHDPHHSYDKVSKIKPKREKAFNNLKAQLTVMKGGLNKQFEKKKEGIQESIDHLITDIAGDRKEKESYGKQTETVKNTSEDLIGLRVGHLTLGFIQGCADRNVISSNLGPSQNSGDPKNVPRTELNGATQEEEKKQSEHDERV